MHVRHPTGLASPATHLRAPPRPPTCLVPLMPPLCGRNNTRSPANPVARATRSSTALRHDATAAGRATSVRAPKTTERKLPVAGGSHPNRRIDAQNSEYSMEFRVEMYPIEITHGLGMKIDYELCNDRGKKGE